MVGYSSRDGAKYGSNTPGLGSSYARGAGGLPTISSSNRPKPNREHYHGFDEDDEDSRGYRMETLVEGGVQRVPKTASSSKGLGVMISGTQGDSNFHDTGSSRGSGDKDRDDDSAKAIIHTKTVQISYEDRPL